MILKRLEEFRYLANKIGLYFFACDDSFLNWYYASSSFLNLIGITEQELSDNPACWLSITDPVRTESLLDELRSTRDGDLPLIIDIPFYVRNDESTVLRLRFCPLSESGDNVYICSAEDLTCELQYKIEAGKARDYEIEVSARIQKALLTNDYSVSNELIEIAAETLPSNQVDGDFYEFISLSDDTIDFIIGDVMGKGVPAALFAAAVKSAFFKALIKKGGHNGALPPITAVLTEIDRSIASELIGLNSFLTFHYCRLDLERNMLSFIDAGHTSIIYYSAEEQRCWSIKGANMPMGFIMNQEYKSFKLPIRRNDVLFFYSDGITEVENSERVQFGVERLEQLLKAHHQLTPAELIKKVLNITFFYASEAFKDDVTAIAIRMKKPEPEVLKTNKFVFGSKGDLDLESVRKSFSEDFSSVNAGGDSRDFSKILIAYIEALSNCIKYAVKGVSTEWRITAETCIMSIVYRSEDFDWYSMILPDIESYQQHGFGLYLINEGVDSFLVLNGNENLKKIIMAADYNGR